MPRTAQLPPGLTKRGSVYYARFTHNGREVKRRLSGDLTVAKRALNDLRARADAGDFGLVSNDYPFADLKAEFLRWAKQATRNGSDYERDLKRFESYAKLLSVQQITAAYVDGYREWRLSQRVGSIAGKEWERASGRTVSPRTVNREVGTLHNMLNLGVRRKLIGCNPLLGMKPLPAGEARKERRALTVAEVESIFREAPEYLRTILRVLCSTGLRRNELTELKFSDVDFERRCITVRASIAKSKRAREVPLDDYALALLTELRDRAADRQESPQTPVGKFSRDHVFVTPLGTPRRNNLLRAFYVVCKRAGIVGGEQGGSVDLHALRGTFATLAIENGASPKAIQTILGHSTLALTMSVYAKATERAKRDAIGALPFTKVSTPEHVVPMRLAQ